MGRWFVLAIVAGMALAWGPPTAARADAESERRVRVRELAKSHTDTAVLGLARIIRHDKHLSVRIEAARGLAENQAPRVVDLLCEMISQGGPDDVRHALADSLSRHEKALERVQARIDARGTDPIGRVLLTTALTRFEDPRSLAALQKLAAGKDPLVRVAALHALGARKDARALMPAVIDLVLSRFTDRGSIDAALDIAEGFDLDGLEVVAPLLDGFRGTLSARQAARVRRRLEFLRDFAEFERTKGTRYAVPQPLEPTFPDTGFHDLVYAIDTTGSEEAWLPGIREVIWREARALGREGLRVRIGFVAYRDSLRDANQKATSYHAKVFPLTTDLGAAADWLAVQNAGGVDTRGAKISSALYQGFARMNWLSPTSRRVELFTATQLDDPQRCFDLTRFYVREGPIALGVRIRPNGKRTPSLVKLAGIAGGDLGSLPDLSKDRVR